LRPQGQGCEAFSGTAFVVCLKYIYFPLCTCIFMLCACKHLPYDRIYDDILYLSYHVLASKEYAAAFLQANFFFELGTQHRRGWLPT